MIIKRYRGTIILGVSAKSKRDAQRILKEIVESGRATSSEGIPMKVQLKQKAIIDNLPF